MRMLCPGPRLAARMRVFVMWIIVRVLVRVCNWKMTVGMRMLCHVCLSSNDKNLLFGSRRESLKPGSISRLSSQLSTAQ
jgi:hypothetical protein